MKKIKFLIFFLFLFELIQSQEISNIVLTDYLNANWKTPENYVIDKFSKHDYVFIGEYHRIKQDVELINNLIPLLYKNHIFNLGIEFGAYELQPLVDSLLNMPIFDRKLANYIYFKTYPVWGYKEYIDLYKTAWEINHKNGSVSKKFRIINLGCLYNPCTKDHFNGHDPDVFMAEIILKEIISKNEKALIYSGSHHAFTRYRQPRYDFAKDTLYGFTTKRMGNVIYDSLKERTFNIYLHAGWISNNGFDSPCVLPVNGVIDSIMNPFVDKRVGFDVINTPFAKLKANDTYYALGYSDFTLDYYCDGYIYQNPFKDYQPITMEKDFITNENLNELKLWLLCIRPEDSEWQKEVESLTMENVNDWLFEDIRKHFAHLIK